MAGPILPHYEGVEGNEHLVHLIDTLYLSRQNTSQAILVSTHLEKRLAHGEGKRNHNAHAHYKRHVSQRSPIARRKGGSTCFSGNGPRRPFRDDDMLPLFRSSMGLLPSQREQRYLPRTGRRSLRAPFGSIAGFSGSIQHAERYFVRRTLGVALNVGGMVNLLGTHTAIPS